MAGITTGIYRANTALAMATLAFAANFSVWTLYAVTALDMQNRLQLSSTELGLLLAAPMLTGAILRMPAGFLAQSYSPRILFIAQMLLVAPSLALLPYIESFRWYIVCGLWIGISGVSFTIGIAYITDWFDRSRQGTAMGIFGAGNAGAAITFFLAPVIIKTWGWYAIGPLYAVGLLIMALLFYLFAPQTPAHLISTVVQSLKEKLEPFKHLQVWRFGLYYYFVFGSFLALIMWLPHYYHNAYKLTIEQAMGFTLFFTVTSSMARAIGGWFSDRYGGRAVNWTVFWVCLVCLFFLSYPPTTMIIHGVRSEVQFHIEINVWVFTALIFVIGIAQGFGRASVYKVIHDHYPHQMGSVGGVVAAVGATGGFTLPVLFGIAVDVVGFYSVCFMLLYGVLAVCMVAMFFALKADRYQQRVREAFEDNFLEG